MKSYIFTGIVAGIAFVSVALPTAAFAEDIAPAAPSAPEGQSASSADVNTSATDAPAAPGGSATSADVNVTSAPSIPAPTGSPAGSTDAPTPAGTSGGAPSGPTGSTGSGGASVSGGPVSITNAFIATVPASCPLLTDYLKFGGANDPSQVTKLQSFLKGIEKLDVDVNGTFDAKTESAVSAFQKKYAASILGPWEASEPSGFVFITTLKTVNQIACASRFALTAEEQAIIDAYIARRDQSSGQSIGQVNGTSSPATGELEIGAGDDENDNVAAVGRASILSRLWDFIKELFR